jgi:lipid II:glycine glycyltransferase (peptidoglycan interpeptide bridge formation enzyme)
MREYNLTSKIDRKQWSDFVFNHPQGNIFQTPEMFDVFMAAKNNQPVLTAVTNADNDILGILVAVIQREHSGLLGKFSSRSVIQGGPLILNNNEEVLNIILKEYNKAINKRVIYTQYRNLWQQDNQYRACFEKNGLMYEEHLDILVDIELPEEKLWKDVHGKRRNEIRRARREGTSFRELTTENEVGEVYDILEDVYGEAKLLLHDRSLFLTAFETLRPKGMIRFFGAINQNKLIGVIVVLCYKDRIYDWYAGSRREYYNKYPNDLLPWEAFLWGKENGYKLFDFGGAGKPGKHYGVRDYKKQFGGGFVNFGRYEKIHKPGLMKLGKLSLKLWKKLR